ncbi:sulfotransferase family protein [Alteraurantiacibacter aquimixticola]|uniref:Sulfotransferase family protein n=1 Tax=Alteraurantiacibacter aquimixticola TaxID=2489173 RepID=A0A4T3EWZ6_9SPHN|nr:sulfotransferase family protein [Alteraurantiacibacter aquimixticola]TIX48978.1 sulfotransferase family protein [Alteraurantiacibacter aquimixticola]
MARRLLHRNRGEDQSRVPKQKVFCIGFQKTGTTSLEHALQSVGYRVKSVFGRDLTYDELKATYVDRGLEIAREYDALEDMPWPLMFRELDAAFPGSKFILTLRDADAWIRSIVGHFRDNAHVMQQLTYGEDAGAPVGNEDRYRAVYEAHNAAVLDYFADRPDDLLVMRLEAGDGWEKLAPFLGIEGAPTGPFVHTNTRKARNSVFRRIRGRMRRAGILS